MGQLMSIFKWLGRHKWKFVLMFVSALTFIFLLFPFSDLSDLVSSQVSKLTHNQIFLQFEKMRVSVFPEAGLALDEVYVEGQGIPALKAREIVATPSLSSLITQKPAGTISAKGFLKGDIEVSLKPGTKSENGVERQKVQLTAKRLNLSELRELLQMPIVLKGNVDASSSALIDLTFQEQPDMDFNLKVDRFELPTSNVQTQMGPLTLPDLKLASVEIRGRLSGGKLLIEEGLIGKDSDEVHGTIKGDIGMVIQNQNGSAAPLLGAYNFDINLNIKKSFQDKAQLFLSFIDSYKTPTPEGALYKFRVTAGSPQVPPNISALR